MDDGTALWTPGRSSRLTSLVISTRIARPTKTKRTALIPDTASLASLWQADGQLTTMHAHRSELFDRSGIKSLTRSNFFKKRACYT